MGATILNNIYDENDENLIEKLLDYQKSKKENGNPLKNNLILMDDFITDNSFNKRRSIFDKLYSMSRHFNISVITTSQSYTLMPSSIRRLVFYPYHIQN